jgi:hypothetical protein
MFEMMQSGIIYICDALKKFCSYLYFISNFVVLNVRTVLTSVILKPHNKYFVGRQLLSRFPHFKNLVMVSSWYNYLAFCSLKVISTLESFHERFRSTVDL